MFNLVMVGVGIYLLIGIFMAIHVFGSIQQQANEYQMNSLKYFGSIIIKLSFSILGWGFVVVYILILMFVTYILSK